MSKKTNQAATPGKTTTSSKKRSTSLVLLLLLAIAAGFAVWKFWPAKEAGYLPDEIHGAEPTLTAKNPLLQLLPASETGVDFQNLIKESAESNITTNINQYNGGGVAIADINNAGEGSFAGAVTAALFLDRFVDKGVRWAHVDLFAWNPAAKPGRPKGAAAMTLAATFVTITKLFSSQ